MIPVGYMGKRIVQRTDWLKVPSVKEIFSVSHCVSDNFMDYIDCWKHNGYWFFNAPDDIMEVAKQNNVNLTGVRLFYYEVYNFQWNDTRCSWEKFSPETAFKTDVMVPASKQLEGYDVVTFWAGNGPECSPLSCNGPAEEIPTNQHCLLQSFEQAKRLVEEGKFKDGEPGPLRIFAVYSIESPIP
jgi:hypothetical protein